MIVHQQIADLMNALVGLDLQPLGLSSDQYDRLGRARAEANEAMDRFRNMARRFSRVDDPLGIEIVPGIWAKELDLVRVEPADDSRPVHTIGQYAKDE